MPPSGRKPEFKISLADVFKSTKTLREEAAAAALKRSILEAKKKAEEVASLPPPPKEPITTPAPDPNAGAKPATSDSAPPAAPESAPAPAPAPAPAAPANAAAPSNPVPEWTAEQDLQLLKMKTENASWRAISTAIGKPVYALKDRWGVIQPKTNVLKQPKAQGEAKPVMTEGNGKGTRRRVSFSEPLVTTDNNDGARDTDSSKKRGFHLDGTLTLEETVLLNKIAAKYEEEKWIRISSRFFDKTGKRHAPRTLKKYILTE
ncbi:hypothetical protein PRK78_001234 [Emydomyces testavorans]|uniref:Myb-like domain-containing protein n=1 Tax=Emydomyces testavorans TaxID=2070801 RepID=A0AAF0DC60_9EURO|nr:hypothetical protein PRK78_001234 [Emydomyces testavorans]